MNNEPVAWAYIKDGEFWDAIHPNEHAKEEGSYDTPLYTHSAKTEDEGKVCARCGAIAYDPVITQTAKTLTDEEIVAIFTYEYGRSDYYSDTHQWAIEFARAILKKASEK
jgi:hypothetical protein